MKRILSILVLFSWSYVYAMERGGKKPVVKKEDSKKWTGLEAAKKLLSSIPQRPQRPWEDGVERDNRGDLSESDSDDEKQNQKELFPILAQASETWQSNDFEEKEIRLPNGKKFLVRSRPSSLRLKRNSREFVELKGSLDAVKMTMENVVKEVNEVSPRTKQILHAIDGVKGEKQAKISNSQLILQQTKNTDQKVSKLIEMIIDSERRVKKEIKFLRQIVIATAKDVVEIGERTKRMEQFVLQNKSYVEYIANTPRGDGSGTELIDSTSRDRSPTV